MTETIKQNPRTCIPAAGYDWLLPLYDPLQKLLGSESDHRDCSIKRASNQVTAFWKSAAAPGT
jgi:hypothetical protein